MITAELMHAPIDVPTYRTDMLKVATESDYASQLAMLNQLEPTPENWSEYCREMHAFAMEPKSTYSAFVRATALEKCARALYGAEGQGVQLDEDLLDVRTAMHREVPEYADALAGRKGHEELVAKAQSYMFAMAQSDYLADRVGLEGEDASGSNPLFASMLMARRPSTVELIETHIQEAPRFVGQVMIGQTAHRLLANDRWRQGPEVALDQAYTALVPLLRYIPGTEYLPHALALNKLQGLPEARAAGYAKAFLELYDDTGKLHEVFPQDPAREITYAARRQLANVLPKAAEHEDLPSWKSEPSSRLVVPLRGGRILEDALHGDDMLKTLNDTHEALRELHETVTDPTNRTVPGVPSTEFALYRFVNPQTKRPPTVKLYIRPEGEQPPYNRDYEYGRPRTGVEGSISYSIQLRKDVPIPLAKHAETEDTISVRLDRESPGDNRAHQGQLSLDIGSVLGRPGSLGARVGMLFASANVAASYMTEEEPSLNHSRLSPSHGVADNFAEMARALDMKMRERVIRAEELRGSYGFSGRVGRGALTLSRTK